jgi:hypothetical protein
MPPSPPDLKYTCNGMKKENREIILPPPVENVLMWIIIEIIIHSTRKEPCEDHPDDD